MECPPPNEGAIDTKLGNDSKAIGCVLMSRGKIMKLPKSQRSVDTGTCKCVIKLVCSSVERQGKLLCLDLC